MSGVASRLGAAGLFLVVSTTAAPAVVFTGFLVNPQVQVIQFIPPNGGLGITSAYLGGLYNGPAGAVLTADVSMTSTAVPLGGKVWQYTWTITNTGTGPFIQYLDTGNGPNFLQGPPLFGTAGADRIPGTADDVAPETETDTRNGGPPVIGEWGGIWNPTADPTQDPENAGAPRLEPSPIPVPATAGLLAGGLLALLGWGRARRR